MSEPFITDTGAKVKEKHRAVVDRERNERIAWALTAARDAVLKGGSPGVVEKHISTALSMLKLQSGTSDSKPSLTFRHAPEERPHMIEERNTHDVLAAVEGTLIEILAELRRGNSVAREGAVSSIKIEDMASKEKPIKILTSYYIGSTITVDDVREAVDLHEYAHAEAERRAMAGWTKTVEALQNGEKP